MNKVFATLGFIAFAIGLLLAIIFGILDLPDGIMNIVVIILLALGIIIGLLNITAREMLPLLIAIIALLVVGNVFEPISAFGIGHVLDKILNLIATLMAPAAIIAAIRILVAVGFPKD